jgi:exodeoxyribonuclease VII small subunit
VEQLSFDMALRRLENIVAELEAGQLSLEDRWRHLKKVSNYRCFARRNLKKSEGKVSRLVKKLNGELELEDFTG